MVYQVGRNITASAKKKEQIRSCFYNEVTFLWRDSSALKMLQLKHL